MRWAAVRRKLGRVHRAIDKAIERSELPGAVVYARMPKHGEMLEHFSRHGLAVVRPERIPMARETLFDLASLTKPIATTTATMLLVTGLPFGHVRANATWPLGGRASIDGSSGEVRILEQGVRRVP